jgi:hypothetical protein
VLGQSWTRRFFILLLAWGAAACVAPAQEPLRLSRNVPGDSKPVIVHADEITTWTEGNERILVLQGAVLIEQNIVHARMQHALAVVDLDRLQRTKVLHVDIYGEGDVQLENGAHTDTGAAVVLDLNTRGELKLRAAKNKIVQQPATNDSLYQRVRGQKQAPAPADPPAPPPGHTPPRRPQAAAAPAAPIQQAVFQEPAIPTLPVAQAASPPPSAAPALPSPAPPPVLTVQDTGPPPLTPPGSPGMGTLPPAGPPAGGGVSGPPSAGPTIPALPAPAPPIVLPPAAAPPAAVVEAPLRRFRIMPRTGAGIQWNTITMPNGEQAMLVTGGIILSVDDVQKFGILDAEADRLVLWVRGESPNMMENFRTADGHMTREIEFYLSGDVVLRRKNGKEVDVLRADELYYDVARNVAVALKADFEFRQPVVPDPIHLKAEEFQQLSPTQFRAVKAEMFASRLPSDPGLKVYVAEGTLEEKKIPKKSLLGFQFFNRKTGEAETEDQKLFDGRDAYVKVEDVPIFYLPFIQGDANDPLGPLRSVTIGDNSIYGFEIGATWNMFDLLGIDPRPGSSWKLFTDYLSKRGPALGTEYDYSGKDIFGVPARYSGIMKSYTIYDTGTDILGGDRGPLDHHPDWRGRFLWRQNVQELPLGFSVQAQFSYLSDQNFLEQYFKREFDEDFNQETFLYVKQQQDNWAWTALGEQRIRNWVTETSWLPRADGYLIGQSFFNLLTYDVHGSAGYGQLRPANAFPPPFEITDRRDDTGRFDLIQELSLPFYAGPVKVVPYGVVDLTEYTSDLTGDSRGRFYGAGGVRASMPLTRTYTDASSDLLNVNGLSHKVVFSSNYYVAHSDTPFTQLPQLDRLDDDATDQAMRDIKPREPFLNPAHGLALATSPMFDPQVYAIRRLVDSNVDTLDTIEELQMDIRQRLQTRRGYPGNEHLVDWMTLDLSGAYFPHPTRDNFGSSFAFLEYDYTWNVGDRTALVSTGWVDPNDDGPRVFTVGAFLNRPDRTNFYIGYRDIFPVDSRALTGAVNYIFSPKYAITALSTYDFGTHQSISNSLVFTRMGTDVQVSFGFSYNAILNNFGVTLEILPNLIPQGQRLPGTHSLSTGGLGR